MTENWNWDHLRFFHALARNNSLKSAGKVLGVSHSTVLRRVKSFEKQLGVQLFIHTPDGYRLTDNGKLLYSRASTLKLSVDSIARTLDRADDKVAGNVTLTAPDTMGYQLIPGILNNLQTTYPDLHIRLIISNEFFDLHRMEADIAIRAGNEPPAALIGRQLGTIQFSGCASNQYLVNYPSSRFPEQTDSHRFIVLNENFNSVPFYNWLNSRVSDEAQVTTVDGLMAAYRLCEAGLGITVLPNYLIDTSHCLVKLGSDHAIESNELWLLSHPDTRDNATVKAVKHFIETEMVRQFGNKTDN